MTAAFTRRLLFFHDFALNGPQNALHHPLGRGVFPIYLAQHRLPIRHPPGFNQPPRRLRQEDQHRELGERRKGPDPHHPPPPLDRRRQHPPNHIRHHLAARHEQDTQRHQAPAKRRRRQFGNIPTPQNASSAKLLSFLSFRRPHSHSPLPPPPARTKAPPDSRPRPPNQPHSARRS